MGLLSSWVVFVGGSGSPVGGSAIDPGLVSPRHTITFVIAIRTDQHDQCNLANEVA